MSAAPPAESFPAYPASWQLFCSSADVGRRPFSKHAFGRKLVAFRTQKGQLAVLDACCAHFGGDLGQGQIIGDTIQCPFHHWQYAADGKRVCSSTAETTIRQMSFPVQERHGLVFVFNGSEPEFALPFFPNAQPDDFIAARPFTSVLDCPWYLIGANHFDVQHFRAAHDRRLISEPVVGTPHPCARSASARFAVSGTTVQDRITRAFAGSEVEMAITDWCGTLMFTTATFRSTRSYGMVATEPLPGGKVAVHVVVFMPRSGSPLAPIRLAVRRWLIRSFLSRDINLLDGIRYRPQGLTDDDTELIAYLSWLAAVA